MAEYSEADVDAAVSLIAEVRRGPIYDNYDLARAALTAYTGQLTEERDVTMKIPPLDFDKGDPDPLVGVRSLTATGPSVPQRMNPEVAIAEGQASLYRRLQALAEDRRVLREALVQGRNSMRALLMLMMGYELPGTVIAWKIAEHGPNDYDTLCTECGLTWPCPVERAVRFADEANSLVTDAALGDGGAG